MSTTEFFLDFNARRQIQPEDDGKNECWKRLTTILRKEQHNNRSYHISGELFCEGPEGGLSQVPGIWKAGMLCLLWEPSLEKFLFVLRERILSSSCPVSQKVAEEEISLHTMSAKLEPLLHQWRASDSSTVFRDPNQTFGSDGPAFNGIVSVLL